MPLALYRKYRPDTFKDILGQDHIVKVLEGAIKNKSVSHAYLFNGSRGTGKTSIARILANELGTSSNDIFEIDAASNRGIDDIRELRESVRTLPFDSDYKVYIIDEVHMLTKEAFNALLKTLEEPPAHVIFILATTELEKIPDTIISRSQTFTFNKPTESILRELIKDIAKKEKFKIDDASAELIALLADHSFRDAQGILQKVMSVSDNNTLESEEIEQVTGAPSSKLVNELIGSLSSKDIGKALSLIKKASEQNTDMKIFLKLILYKFRILLLLRFAPDMRKEIEHQLSESDVKFFQEVLAEKSDSISSKSLLVLLEAYQQIMYSFIPELPLELAMITILGQDKQM
ncbi:DNA polymerase III, subunit gamma and tau [Candidatus Wolfebacteria bacterium]|nr:MAG: DNA polymerase III, subunit gamma and tau [Candidatus Wolfebacteria bacterium]